MDFLYIFIIILLIIFVVFYRKFLLQKESKLFLERERTKLSYEINKKKQELEEELKQKKDSVLKELTKYTNKINALQTEISKLIDQQKTVIDSEIESYQKAKQKELDAIYSQKRVLADKDLEDYYKYIQQEKDEANLLLQEYYNTTAAEKQTLSIEIEKLKQVIDDYQSKIEIIQQEIAQRRKVEEQTDFYRICLPQSSLQDIQILESIRRNLTNPLNLDKMIYDTYLSKSVMEMTKRVLSGEAPCGIYKITRLKTGEIYIGKSTDIKSRWQQHIKSVYNCGTIARTTLHTTMAQDGVENFTFELIEKVPKDKLGEREKYWIEFYKSKEYGLNMKAGG